MDAFTTDSIPSKCSLGVGIDEAMFGSTIKVYPNPIENSFEIEGAEGLLEISIYNSLGKLMHKEETFNGAVQVELVPGMYFLNIKQVASNKVFKTKLIKN